jgi:hypothetical protein
MGVGADGNNVPAVVLSAREELLPIFVTEDQANAIRLAMEGEQFERPLTHDLLVDMVTEFGGAVDRVRIDDLSEGTFFAKVDAERYEEGEVERFVFDARPSDAIALAVRVDCPIEVSDEILDAAGRPPSAISFEGSTGTDHDDDDWR